MLYNKDSIIEYLLKEDGPEKTEMGKVAGVKGTVEGGFVELGNFGERVKGLKDVVEVKFEVGEGERELGGRGEKWVCPITGKELGLGAKAVYIVPCGHAFAGSVVREVAGSACLTVCTKQLKFGWAARLIWRQCNEAYAENDVIPILPTLPTDIARLNLRSKMLREKGLTHALKKAPGSKKRKKGADGEEKKKASDEEKAKKAQSADNGIKNASTASLTQKVMKEQEERNKRRKMVENANVKSLFNTSDHKPDMKKSADYMTRGFSIGKK